MTVSTVSQDDTATPDMRKRHFRPDQDHKNEHRLPHNPSTSMSGPTAEGASIPRRQSSSPIATEPTNRRSSDNGRSNHENNNNNTINIHSSSNYINYTNQNGRSDNFNGHHADYSDKEQCSREDSSWTNSGHSREAAQARPPLDEHETRYPHRGQQDYARIRQECDDDKGSSVGSNDQADNNDDFQDEAMSDEDNMEEDELDESEGSLVAQDNSNMSSTSSKEKSNSLVINMYTSRKHVKVRSMFVDKLFRMVEDPSIQHLISWAKEGDMFYVYNCIKLSDTVLPRFFKHNNWQSFVRQLNMYGFHKIYRYDREESNMNRKNPETQRWQFYHPHFQRDFPHLRKNIKRKSARSMNTAPATSRVVFEHGKGYFLQRNDRSRSNSGENIHTQQSQNQPSAQVRPHNTESKTKSSPVQQQQMPPQPHISQTQPPLSRHSSDPSPTTRLIAGTRPPTSTRRSPRESGYRDDASDHPANDRDPLPPHGHHQHASHSPYHHSDSHRPGMHHRQYSLQNQHTHSPLSGSSDRPIEYSNRHGSPSYGHDAAHRSTQAHPGNEDHATHEHRPESAPRTRGHFHSHSLSRIDHRKASLHSKDSNEGSPLGRHRESPLSPRPANAPPEPQSNSHVQQPQASPRTLQNSHGTFGDTVAVTAPTTRVQQPSESPKNLPSLNEAFGFNGNTAEDSNRHSAKSSTNTSPHLAQNNGPPSHQSSLHHDAHQRHRLHPMGAPMHKGLSRANTSVPSGNSYNVPPQSHQTMQSPAMMTSPLSAPATTPIQLPHSQLSSASSQTNRPPGSPSNPDSNLEPNAPSVIKDLEQRLHFIEDAYMSLRQYTQKLQQIQSSQDQTIGWMRERIDQMTDVGHGQRDPMASPPTPLTGAIMSTKRKTEPNPEESRSRVRYDPSISRHSHGHGHGHGYGIESQSHGYGRDDPGYGPAPEGPPYSGRHYDPSLNLQSPHHHQVPHRHAQPLPPHTSYQVHSPHNRHHKN